VDASGRGMRIPPTVQEVILRRLERLDQEEERVLETASVIGPSFDVQLIKDALGIDWLQLLDSIDSLAKKHQLIIEGVKSHIFTHEMIRGVTYSHMSMLRRRELHRLVGSTLERGLPNDDLLGSLSLHFYEAGDDIKCVDYSLRVGEYFVAKWAMVEAIPYFQRAIESMERTRYDESLMQRAYEGLGRSFYAKSDWQASSDIYHKLLTMHLPGKKRAGILTNLASIWQPFLLGGGDSKKANAFLDKAERCEGIESSEIGYIKTTRANIALQDGRLADAERSNAESEEFLHGPGDEENLAMVLTLELTMYRMQGRIREAIEKGKQALQVISKYPYSQDYIETTIELGRTYGQGGRYEEALSTYAPALDMAKKLGYDYHIAWGHYYRAESHMLEEKFVEALGDFKLTLATAKEMGSAYLEGLTNAFLAHCYGNLGEMRYVQNCLNYALTNLNGLSESNTRDVLEAICILVQGEVLCMLGNRDSGIGSFESALLSKGFLEISLSSQAEGRRWFGTALAKHGETDRAREQLDLARAIFSKLGNEGRMKRIDDLLKII